MSLATFVEALGSMTVTGVRKTYAAPPTSLATANLPALYPRVPASLDSRIPVLTSAATDLQRHVVELVIVVNPIGQSLAPLNFAATVALIDAMHTALAALAGTSDVVDSWSMAVTAEQIGAEAYWVLVETVEGTE